MLRFNFQILKFFLYTFLTFILIYGIACQEPPPDILIEENLRKEHPRLIFTNDDQLRIEEMSRQNPILQRLIDALFDQANRFLSEPTIKYEIVDTRRRLLQQSRACLAKVFTHATAYRLSGDHKYAHRAIKEMKTATSFPDWNPSHFLDVGEMSTAIAIGYDWLFNMLSDEDKLIFKNALIEYGLKPALREHPDRFYNKINNWNFVCNGGRRWNYFRLSSLSHNIPTINNQNQKFDGQTRIVAFHSSPERSHAIADLSPVYYDQAKTVKRGVAVLNRNALLIQDEVVGLQQEDQLRWAMLTSAQISLKGNRADLQIKDKHIDAEIILPVNAVFDTASTKPTYHPDESLNPGTCLLTVSVPLKINETNTVAIVLRPKMKAPSRLSRKINIIPLSKWKGYF